MMDTPQGTRKIFYIGGAGRSGSTLLERVLNGIEDFFAVGELSFIWDKGYRTNQRCSCGEYFEDCSFWSAVDDAVFSGLNDKRVRHISELQEGVNRRLKIPARLFRALRSTPFNQKLNELRGYYGNLYSGIFDVTSAEVIIDSSKSPMQALLLNELEGYELYLIHLVRDSRAVANSWNRKKRRREVDWKEIDLPRYGPTKSSMNWNFKNGMFFVLSDRFSKYYRVRYEDFVRTPKPTLNELLEWSEETGRSLEFIEGKTIESTEDEYHSVSGNPSRFNRNGLTLKIDDEWKNNLSWLQKFYVTTLTVPLLKKFGYRILV